MLILYRISIFSIFEPYFMCHYVKSVRIRSISRPYSAQMRENTDQ